MEAIQRSPRQAVAYYLIHKLVGMTTSKIGSLYKADRTDLEAVSFNRIVSRAVAAEAKQELEA